MAPENSYSGSLISSLNISKLLLHCSLTKKLEYLFKKMKSGSKISCIPPKRYSKRFTEFMQSIIV